MSALYGEISLNATRAYDALRAWRRELQAATKDSMEFKVKVVAPRDAGAAVAKTAIADARALEAATKAQTAAINQQGAALRLKSAQEREAGKAAREADREVREALRAQKQEGAALARELEAGWRRNGYTVDRFGEQVKTVTGYLKDISKDVKVGLKFDPRDARHNIDAVLAQIHEAQRAAGLTVKADTDQARAALDNLLGELKQVKSAAHVTVTFDQAGLKTAIVDAQRSAQATADDMARDTARRVERRRGARERLADEAQSGAAIGGGIILAGAGAAAHQLVEFDRSLRNVNTIAQLSEDSLQKVGDQVLRLSADDRIRKGPRDLAAALYDIYSSGKSGPAALETLEDAALGASAGVTDTATSAKVLLATLNSGIGGVNNSREAMNVLFKVVDRGTLSFGELSGSLGAVLPTASKAGIPLQQLGAYLAVATKSGQSASEATNDLLNLITKIANPGEQARKTFNALGIEYGFSALQSKGLAGVLAEIQAKTGGNADAIKKLLPDMQAQRGALTALKDAGADYRQELGEMGRANEGVGALMRAVTKQNQGAAAEYDNLKDDMEALAITAGKSVVPALGSVVRVTKEGFEWFGQLDRTTQDQIVRFTAYGGVALVTAAGVAKVVTIVKLLREAELLAVLATDAHTAALGRNATAAQAAGAANLAGARTAGAAWLRVLGPLATVAAAIYAVKKSWDEWTPDFSKLDDAALKRKYGIAGELGVAAGQGLGWFLPGGADDLRQDRKLYEAFTRTLPHEAIPPSFEDWRAGRGKTRSSFEGSATAGPAPAPASKPRPKTTPTSLLPPGYPSLDELGLGDDGGGRKARAAKHMKSYIEEMGEAIKTPEGKAGCAIAVSKLIQGLGYALPITPVARDLRDKLKDMGAERVSPKDIQEGDVLFYRGARYGAIKYNEGGQPVGYHVTMAAGGGMMTGTSSNAGGRVVTQKIYRPGEAEVYRLPSLGQMERTETREARAEGKLATVALQRTFDDPTQVLRKVDFKEVSKLAAIRNAVAEVAVEGRKVILDALPEAIRGMLDRATIHAATSKATEAIKAEQASQRAAHQMAEYWKDAYAERDAGNMEEIGAFWLQRQDEAARQEAFYKDAYAEREAGNMEEIGAAWLAATETSAQLAEGLKRLGQITTALSGAGPGGGTGFGGVGDWKGAKRAADITVEQARREAATARFNEWMAGQGLRMASLSELDPVKRQLLELEHQVRADGLLDWQISVVLDAQRAENERVKVATFAQNAIDGFGNVIDGGLRRVQEEGFGGFFKGVLSDLRQWQADMAREIAVGAAKKALGGLFGNLLGLGGGGAKITPLMGGGADAPKWVDIADAHSHAAGLDFVPYDNYRANLHHREMVLAADEAEDYRRMKRQASRLSSGGRGSTYGGGAGGGQTIHVVINGPINLPQVRSGADFPREMTRAVSNRLPQATLRRRAWEDLSDGAEER
jgi:TP901 family phage tail tape measure protein